MSQSGSYFGGGTPLPDIETLTGNVGGAVGPDGANNIDISGVDPVLVTGTPASNSLDISVDVATEVDDGIMRFATIAETLTGTIGDAAVHPLGLNTKLGVQTLNTLAYGNGPNNAIQWLPDAFTGEVLLGSTGNPPVWTGPALDGEVLIGNTGGDPIWANLVAGTNVTITNTANQIVISSTGGGGPSLGITTLVCDSGTAIDPGTGIVELLGDTNITTQGAADLAQVTLNDNVTILGDYSSLNGHLNLPTTTSALAAGTIQWNSVTYIHNYGTDNFFAGSLAGNGTLINAFDNVGIGKNVLTSLTTGNSNSSVGNSSLTALTSGKGNCVLGIQGGSSIISGDNNVLAGKDVAQFLVSGDNNIIIGWNAGINYGTSESSNILLSNNGIASESNVMRLGDDGVGVNQINDTYVAGIYQRTPSSTSEVTLTDTDGKVTTTGAAINGEVLIGRTGLDPVWSTLTAGSNIGVTNASGAITIGTTGFTNNGLTVGTAGGNLASLAAATNGQLPIGSSGADPIVATLTAGAGINITNGAGSITIENTGAVISEGGWTPTLSFVGQTVAPTWSVTSARYIKIGNLVHINLDLSISSKGTAPSTAIFSISGFPFSTNGLDCRMTNGLVNTAFTNSYSTVYYVLVGTSATLQRLNNNVSNSPLTWNEIPTSGKFTLSNTYAIAP